jgi:putative tryptophan/tyrosine transport system substrate-binding protein
VPRYVAIPIVGFAVVVGVLSPVRAQAPGKIYRIAVLATGEFQPGFPVPPATLAELARHGLVEGHNLKIEPQFGARERLLDLAREVVQTHPDVILTGGTLPARAARTATETIPIVGIAFDFEDGLVATLARPGGNLTGATNFTAELDIKRLAILHELVPAAQRIALLGDPPGTLPQPIAPLEAAARGFGVAV